MNAQFAKIAKEMLFRSPFRRFVFPRYVYEFTPPQLLFLCRCLDETRDVPGSVFEVGCSSGATTIFLNKYMDAESIEKPYYAIDTFSGFVAADVAFEVVNRSKTAGMYAGRFEANKKKWYDATMRDHGLGRVRSIQADANEFDFTCLGPLSFALLDVDLYRPIRNGLEKLYGLLGAGGIIVVDDCDPNVARWDGAHQAYREFMAGLGRAPEILYRKLGVVRKALVDAPVGRA